MYRQHLSQKASPSLRSTPKSQNVAPSPSYGSLSSVVQRVQQDPNSVSEDERQQLESAIGTRSTREILAGKQTPWVPEFQGISAQLWGDAGHVVAPIQAKLSISEQERSPQPQEQRPNKTGLPDRLKTGLENLSGYSMDDVRVHYNSDKPSRLQALAYTQGTDIHVASGQEQYLPHEAWHVVQQKQRRVTPTLKAQGMAVNDDQELEQEADVIGQKALEVGGSLMPASPPPPKQSGKYQGSSSGDRSVVVQPKLPKGLKVGTKVIKHEEDGDHEDYVIEKVISGNYTIKNTSTKELTKTVSTSDLRWGTTENQGESRKEWDQSKGNKKVDEDAEALKLGENYLSADYRRINPLLGALEAVGYSAAQVADPKLDITPKQNEILAQWKKIAVERKNASEVDVLSWDLQHLQNTLAMFKSIHRVWSKFNKKPIPDNVVCRGDTVALYKSYPFLNPAVNDYRDGEKMISQEIEWPGIMSTTVGDPKSHNFIQAKSLVWKITVPKNHAGKVLGENNKSEAEATFPVGTKIHINRLLVRRKDKTLLATEFGSVAEVIIFATILSTEEPSQKPVEEESHTLPLSSSLMTEDMPPPPPPPTFELQTLTPQKKVLSVQEQMQLGILKRGLKNAKEGSEEALEMQKKIAALEGTVEVPQKKVLSVQEQMQLGILKRGLKNAKEGSEEALEMQKKIAALEGTVEVPQKKVLSVQEQMQLGILKRGLKNAKEGSEEALEMQKKIAALEGTVVEAPKKKGILSQEERLKRLALQEEIIKKHLQNVPEVPASESPQAILMMGGPGAGKSSAIPLVVSDPKNYLMTNPDNIKEQLPEYQAGLLEGDKEIADRLHNESKLIADELADKAIVGRRHIIYDSTGANLINYSSLIQKLKSAKYQITLVMVHVNKEEGLRRMRERAVKEGRYVDEGFARSAYPAIADNFIRLAPDVDKALLYDNTDTKPNLVWTQENNIAAAKEVLGTDKTSVVNPPTKIEKPSQRSEHETLSPETMFWRSLDQFIQETQGDRARLVILLGKLSPSQRRSLRQSYQDDIDLVLGYSGRVDEEIQQIVIGIIDEFESIERERASIGRHSVDKWGGHDSDSFDGWGKTH